MISRRRCLQNASLGFGWLGVQSLMAQPQKQLPNFKAPAKSVILVYLSGGLSQVDSFDPKPMLKKYEGKPAPMEVKATMFDNIGTMLPSPWEFRQRGQSGLPVSDLFPHIATMADDLCVVRSMTSKASEHAQGNFYFHSGFTTQGHPSAGAWMSYGLGSENSNLPNYVVLRSGTAVSPIGGSGIYSNGFLPALNQASFLSVDKKDVLTNLKPQDSQSVQIAKMAVMKKMDLRFNQRLRGQEAIESAITNYQTAFRMQASVPEACDLSSEPEYLKKSYGIGESHKHMSLFGQQCLTARRLVERGVRFIELSCLPQLNSKAQSVNPWDQHSDLKKGHTDMAKQVDQPVAALLKDLKSRGLLESTIVLFSGEFGRTPFAQGTDGRDHDPYGFSLWLAGGGFKQGFAFGTTDEFGYHVVQDKMTIYDLWATIQHQMGVDHEKATYHYGGLDHRLSHIDGEVKYDLIS